MSSNAAFQRDVVDPVSQGRALASGAPAAWRLLVLALCLAAGAAYLRSATQYEQVPPRESFTRFPLQVDAWRGADARLPPQIVDVLGVTEYVNRVYGPSAPGLPSIGLYVGYYQSQRQGETVHSPMNCLPGAGWSPISSGRTRISIDGTTAAGAVGTAGHEIEVNRYLVQRGGDRVLVLYWYQSHGRIVASEYWGKIYTVLDAIRLNRTDAALVRVVVPISSAFPERQAEAAAVRFVRSMFPLLERHLPA
jgi:EpsI family protein